MSIDINFWRYKSGQYRDDHAAVYHTVCCDGNPLDCLETLPVDAIRRKLAETFADWDALDENNYEKAGAGAFEISMTPQSVRFNCYSLSNDTMNLLLDVLLAFGCPLYDPQIDTRFDTPPAFEGH